MPYCWSDVLVIGHILVVLVTTDRFELVRHIPVLSSLSLVTTISLTALVNYQHFVFIARALIICCTNLIAICTLVLLLQVLQLSLPQSFVNLQYSQTYLSLNIEFKCFIRLPFLHQSELRSIDTLLQSFEFRFHVYFCEVFPSSLHKSFRRLRTCSQTSCLCLRIQAPLLCCYLEFSK